MRTNREIYKAAFRPLRTSDDFWMEVQTMKANNRRPVRRATARLAVVACALALCAVTALAAVLLLSPQEVAHEVGNEKLEQALASDAAVSINETQTFAAHRVTLLGLVSGEDISDLKPGERADEIEGAHTYCVLSVARTDGKALGADGESFLFAPWIGGRNPTDTGVLTRGYWSLYADDGKTEYYILDAAALAPYAAERAVWLGVQDGGFFGEAAEDQTAFLYDGATGTYSRNPAYDGVNALFDLTGYLR